MTRVPAASLDSAWRFLVNSPTSSIVEAECHWPKALAEARSVSYKKISLNK